MLRLDHSIKRFDSVIYEFTSTGPDRAVKLFLLVWKHGTPSTHLLLSDSGHFLYASSWTFLNTLGNAAVVRRPKRVQWTAVWQTGSPCTTWITHILWSDRPQQMRPEWRVPICANNKALDQCRTSARPLVEPEANAAASIYRSRAHSEINFTRVHTVSTRRLTRKWIAGEVLLLTFLVSGTKSTKHPTAVCYRPSHRKGRRNRAAHARRASQIQGTKY